MKAARGDYDQPAFFFSETKEESRRLVAWFPTVEGQIETFFRLLDKMEPRVRYLLKEDQAEGRGDLWTHFWGGTYRDDLKSLIEQHAAWFFDNGGFQFCFREAEGERNIAYDEHGVFFIYEFGKEDREELERLGAVEKKRELVMDKPHWTRFSRDAEQNLAEFKAALKEASVFYDDEAEDEDPSQEPSD